MEPVLPGDCPVTVIGLARPAKVGDVLVFPSLRHGKLCCHRVVQTRAADGAVLTKGDAFDTPDGWIPRELHVGIVESFVCGGKRYRPHGSGPSWYRRRRQQLSRYARRYLGRCAAFLSGKASRSAASA